MVELFIVLLLVASVVPAFMPTGLALRRALAGFIVLALTAFFTAIHAPRWTGFKFGEPEVLILAGGLSILLLFVSSAIRVAILRRRKPAGKRRERLG